MRSSTKVINTFDVKSLGLQGAINGPMSVSDCYIIPLAAHLVSILIICTVNIQDSTFPHQTERSSRITSYHCSRTTQHLRVPSARYVNSFLPKHHTALYCRQSLFMKALKFTINTLWSIYCYAGNVLRWPSSCPASRDWHVALKSSTFGSKDFNKRERKSQRRRKEGKKDEKALSSPHDCSYWDKREEPSGEPSPRPRAGPEREDREKTDERKEIWLE